MNCVGSRNKKSYANRTPLRCDSRAECRSVPQRNAVAPTTPASAATVANAAAISQPVALIDHLPPRRITPNPGYDRCDAVPRKTVAHAPWPRIGRDCAR